MSLTLTYPDGSPLAIIPVRAANIIRQQHQQRNPRCSCRICSAVNDDDSNEDDDIQQLLESNSNNRSRRRRRSYSPDINDYDSDLHEPQRKRQRISETNGRSLSDRYYNDESDDEIEAYTMSELQGLTVKDLKELLRKQKFPVSGNKSKLIDRLLYPEQTIREIKYSSHRKRPHGVWVHESTSQRTVDQLLQNAAAFNEDDYIWKNGKVKRRLRRIF